MPHSSTAALWSDLFQRRSERTPRLRFELGGDEFNNTTQHVPRFLRAHGRSCAVADSIFTDACIGVVAWDGFQQPEMIGVSGKKQGFEALHATGFTAPEISTWREDPYPHPDEERQDWTLRAYELRKDKPMRDTLLWHAVAREMPIYPSVPVTICLIEPERQIMLHVYDNRGMDVVSTEAGKLRPFYEQFSDWLLDYDRSWMATQF